jgi:hypothetical protein
MPNQPKNFPHSFGWGYIAQTSKEIEEIWRNNNNHAKPIEDMIPHTKGQIIMKK